MTDPHAEARLRTWDTTAEDLDDASALHLDVCSACRRVFDERFPPVAQLHPASPSSAAADRPPPASRRLPLRGRWVFAAALLAAAALLIVRFPSGAAFEAPTTPPPVAPLPAEPETTWQTFLTASANLDGERARDAVAAYQALAPNGEHQEYAESAARRLKLVGARADLSDASWVTGQPPGAGDWLGVLWQVWCRYCLPALRRLELLHTQTPVVALTSATRGTTHAEVVEAAAGMHVPVAILAGPASSTLDVRAWPSALLVCGGVVRWVGGSEELNDTNTAAPCTR